MISEQSTSFLLDNEVQNNEVIWDGLSVVSTVFVVHDDNGKSSFLKSVLNGDECITVHNKFSNYLTEFNTNTDFTIYKSLWEKMNKLLIPSDICTEEENSSVIYIMQKYVQAIDSLQNVKNALCLDPSQIIQVCNKYKIINENLESYDIDSQKIGGESSQLLSVVKNDEQSAITQLTSSLSKILSNLNDDSNNFMNHEDLIYLNNFQKTKSDIMDKFLIIKDLIFQHLQMSLFLKFPSLKSGLELSTFVSSQIPEAFIPYLPESMAEFRKQNLIDTMTNNFIKSFKHVSNFENDVDKKSKDLFIKVDLLIPKMKAGLSEAARFAHLDSQIHPLSIISDTISAESASNFQSLHQKYKDKRSPQSIELIKANILHIFDVLNEATHLFLSSAEMTLIRYQTAPSEERAYVMSAKFKHDIWLEQWKVLKFVANESSGDHQSIEAMLEISTYFLASFRSRRSNAKFFPHVNPLDPESVKVLNKLDGHLNILESTIASINSRISSPSNLRQLLESKLLLENVLSLLSKISICSALYSESVETTILFHPGDVIIRIEELDSFIEVIENDVHHSISDSNSSNSNLFSDNVIIWPYIVIISLFVIVLCGGLAFWFVHRKHKQQANNHPLIDLSREDSKITQREEGKSISSNLPFSPKSMKSTAFSNRHTIIEGGISSIHLSSKSTFTTNSEAGFHIEGSTSKTGKKTKENPTTYNGDSSYYGDQNVFAMSEQSSSNGQDHHVFLSSAHSCARFNGSSRKTDSKSVAFNFNTPNYEKNESTDLPKKKITHSIPKMTAINRTSLKSTNATNHKDIDYKKTDGEIEQPYQSRDPIIISRLPNQTPLNDFYNINENNNYNYYLDDDNNNNEINAPYFENKPLS